MPSQPGSHLSNSPWAGIIKCFPARESLVSIIPAGDGKNDNLFLQCNSVPKRIWSITVFTYSTHKNYYYRITTYVKHPVRDNRATWVNIFLYFFSAIRTWLVAMSSSSWPATPTLLTSQPERGEHKEWLSLMASFPQGSSQVNFI